MRRRQPVPTCWLMTDERLDATWPDGALWTALARMPRGAGVVFRHHATPSAARRELLALVARRCRARGLVLAVAGERYDLRAATHGRRASLTWPAHNRPQAIAAVRAGARAVFVSPIFPTRSHPGAPILGPVRAALIARGLQVTKIALGGMDARRFRRTRTLGFEGWAAIDAWTMGPRRQPASET